MEYLTFFWEHMAWLAQFVIRWAGLPDAQRQATLGDPWAFLDLTADVTPDQPGIRNVLLFLTFPLVFEPTSSDAAKRRIRDGLADSIDGVTGDDLKAVNRDILAIRAATMRHTPGPFTWWEPRWREIWDTADTTPGPAPTDPDPVAPSLPGLALPRATAELATTVYLPTTWLDEYIGLLESRHQLIVYGPPGTGKTFVARRVARHVAGDERVAVVQFHPSYAYEDFFEGLRPVTTGGNVSYRLAPGPLRRIAAAAIEDPDHPHVLIIDEINRADVARVFGELYYLLEYRDDQIALQYSPEEPFSLPKNLYLIGTMNTADRSIAMVDAAIRRRFPFMEMHPSEEPVAGVLGTYLAAVGGTAERSELLAELNSQLPGKLREFQIGPSYLMRPEAATEAGLSRVWRYDILPLLEEQLYGTHARDQVHANFGLDAIRKVLAAKRQQRLQPESALVQPET
ncbi:MAG: AAA family ATPase [Propionibacteriaceae bacterium]|nr:AAA family ATPase [Propionibacteriaceae bacterium]